MNIIVVLFSVPFKKSYMKICFIIISYLIMILTLSRAAIIGTLIFSISFLFIMKRKSSSKKSDLNIAVYIIIIIAFFLTIVYPILVNTNIGFKLQELSITLFNKNFFSGREIIWSDLITLIIDQPILGYGLNSTPNNLLNINISSHNLYLQTAIQCGLIGCALLINVLYQIFKRTKIKVNCFTYPALCFIFAEIIYQCFEVSLTQNNWPVGFFFWIIIGLGINDNIGDEKEKGS